MNQFGCPKSRDPKSRAAGTGGPPDGTFKNLATGATETRSNGGNIKDENISKDSNKPGTLSMANTGQKNSGGSQLFMNVNDNKNLDWFTGGASKHPVFGKLVDKASYDLAVKISKVRTFPIHSAPFTVHSAPLPRSLHHLIAAPLDRCTT